MMRLTNVRAAGGDTTRGASCRPRRGGTIFSASGPRLWQMPARDSLVGVSRAEMARELGVHRSTVTRDFQKRYSASGRCGAAQCVPHFSRSANGETSRLN
jgi:hypothetical protein